PVDIQWTIKNIGANPAVGSWSDAAYLSPSAIWNFTNPVIGRFSFSGTLAPGATYTGTLHANLPLATPGSYRVVIRADIFDDVFESSDLNNTTASPGVLNVTVPALQLGVPLPTTLNSGQDRLYQVTVTQGQTLRVDVTSAASTAANELFIRFGALPTASTYDASYQGALQANQHATIPSKTAGI